MKLNGSEDTASKPSACSVKSQDSTPNGWSGPAMWMATATSTPSNAPPGRSNSDGKGFKGLSNRRRWLSKLFIALRERFVTHSWYSVGIQVVVGVCRAHEPVLHDGCTFGRRWPRHGALERPWAKPVNDYGSTDGTAVNLALLGMHAAVYARACFVRFSRECSRLDHMGPAKWLWGYE